MTKLSTLKKEILADFEKNIGHDDWCKSLKYPKSSWTCNCYMKDSLHLLFAAIERTARETAEAVEVEPRKELSNVEKQVLWNDVMIGQNSRTAEAIKEITSNGYNAAIEQSKAATKEFLEG